MAEPVVETTYGRVQGIVRDGVFAADGVPSTPALGAWPADDLERRSTMVFDSQRRLEGLVR